MFQDTAHPIHRARAEIVLGLVSRSIGKTPCLAGGLPQFMRQREHGHKNRRVCCIATREEEDKFAVSSGEATWIFLLVTAQEFPDLSARRAGCDAVEEDAFHHAREGRAVPTCAFLGALESMIGDGEVNHGGFHSARLVNDYYPTLPPALRQRLS